MQVLLRVTWDQVRALPLLLRRLPQEWVMKEFSCLIYYVRSCPLYLKTQKVGLVLHPQMEAAKIWIRRDQLLQLKLRRIQTGGPRQIGVVAHHPRAPNVKGLQKGSRQ